MSSKDCGHELDGGAKVGFFFLVWLMIQLLFQNSSFSFSFLDYVVDDYQRQ